MIAICFFIYFTIFNNKISPYTQITNSSIPNTSINNTGDLYNEIETFNKKQEEYINNK